MICTRVVIVPVVVLDRLSMNVFVSVSVSDRERERERERERIMRENIV